MDRIAYRLPEAAELVGVSRTRIFEAARNRELTIRKAGRASIVTRDDLLAWIKSLPVKNAPIAAALNDLEEFG
jgi:excisionase family DNA binding protein